jgi:UDP-N-acetylmuramoyl-tripeptide--D-alanyl-D-alanine ligase
LKNSDIKDTTILFKGSQGGIYLEDAVKELLLDPIDAEKLVRQSQSWKQIKAKFYDSFSQSQK